MLVWMFSQDLCSRHCRNDLGRADGIQKRHPREQATYIGNEMRGTPYLAAQDKQKRSR